jgi:hypothetical protein
MISSDGAVERSALSSNGGAKRHLMFSRFSNKARSSDSSTGLDITPSYFVAWLDPPSV